ncbi:hypothetical protein ABK905_05015 [Acerihabitans sp. KWT182]|uniref:Uncharacterized protein n=1 Tax=Acerihabitans sp. KWT182 TaxID=3157919 RepID=A0AAU7QBU4_9GAMM
MQTLDHRDSNEDADPKFKVAELECKSLSKSQLKEISVQFNKATDLVEFNRQLKEISNKPVFHALDQDVFRDDKPESINFNYVQIVENNLKTHVYSTGFQLNKVLRVTQRSREQTAVRIVKSLNTVKSAYYTIDLCGTRYREIPKEKDNPTFRAQTIDQLSVKTNMSDMEGRIVWQHKLGGKFKAGGVDAADYSHLGQVQILPHGIGDEDSNMFYTFQ